MSTNDNELGDGPTLATVWPVFAKIALVPFLPGLAFLVYAAVYASEGNPEPMAFGVLLVWLAFVILITPLIIIAVYFSAIFLLWLTLFVFLGDDPGTGWLRQMRTVTRATVILVCIAGIAFTIPRLLKAPTWKAFNASALAGVAGPATIIMCLFISRIEERTKGLQKTEGPGKE